MLGLFKRNLFGWIANLIFFILFSFTSFAEDYNNPLTRSIADRLYCKINGCSFLGEIPLTIWSKDQTYATSRLVPYFVVTSSAIGSNSNVTADIFIIDKDGNVGVGTANPTSKLNVNGTANITGNITGNSIYGELWNYTSSGFTIDLVVSEEYENFTNMKIGTSNGFTQGNNGSIIPSMDGKYKIDFGVSFTGGNNNEYGIGIGKNGEIQRNCYTRKDTSSTLKGNTGTSCILSINSGDAINIMMDDEADLVVDPSIYQSSLTILRVGDK